MSKRKSSFLVEKVLPDDDHLGKRNELWRSFMEKYSKSAESEELELTIAVDGLDCDVTSESLVDDVESEGSDDSDQENREELNKQLQLVVDKRKRSWQSSGLQKLMESIEDQKHRFNMRSQEKVENWLFNRSGGTAREMTQGHETLMTELNEDGDRMRFYRKQQLTVSSKDDEDSLYSVDTAKYILSNKKNKNSFSKIKVTTMIKQYTISTNNPSSTFQPKLHSISTFPAIEEEHKPPAVGGRQPSKSDSTFEAGEKQKKSIGRKFPVPLLKHTPPPAPEKSNERKKVFKKTMKKKANGRKSPTTRRQGATEELEKALVRDVQVKKVPLIKSKQKRIHWKETSLSEKDGGKNNSSSSDEDRDEVFIQAKPKQKTPPKRELRRKPTRRPSDSVESDPSPRKKLNSPPKNVDKDLVEPFKAICLSPTKRATRQPRERLDFTNQTDQTTNMTAIFNKANEKIVNSTEISNQTTMPTASANTTSSRRDRNGFPDWSSRIVVYKPPTILPNLPADERLRITVNDLNLESVTKPRHLEKFKKFSCIIHPNSSVHFFPSDSEQDEPELEEDATPQSDEDESFDDNDPILTYNPRFTNRLNVMECPHEF